MSMGYNLELRVALIFHQLSYIKFSSVYTNYTKCYI